MLSNTINPPPHSESTEQTADEFAVFDSYDDFDARHGKLKTARKATDALIDERIAKYGIRYKLLTYGLNHA